MSFDESILAQIVDGAAQADLEVIIIGNVAAVLHGVPVLTQDVDFMVREHAQLDKKLLHFAEILGEAQTMSNHVLTDTSMKLKILCVVGARPNFMKIAPLMRELAKHDRLEAQLVHTGQHYSPNLSKLFFEDLALPQPGTYLGVGSADHGVQTAKIMIAFEGLIRENKPDLVVVVGDVNSTLACALVAVKQGVPVAHIEAGLRSFDGEKRI